MTTVSPYSTLDASPQPSIRTLTVSIVMLCTLIIASLGILFTSHAQAAGQSVCTSTTIMSNNPSEHYTTLEQKLHYNGIPEVSYSPLDTTNAKNTTTPCVIVDYTARDTVDTHVLTALKNNTSIRRVFISTPFINPDDTTYHDAVEKNATVRSQVQDNDHITVIDYSDVAKNRSVYNNDGSLTNRGVTTKNAKIVSTIAGSGTTTPDYAVTSDGTTTDNTSNDHVDGTGENDRGAVTVTPAQIGVDPLGTGGSPDSPGIIGKEDENATAFESGSPKERMELIRGITDMSQASRFTVAGRWSAIQFPSTTSGENIMDSGLRSVTSIFDNSILKLLGLINKAGLHMTIYAFSGGILSATTRFADAVFSTLTNNGAFNSHQTNGGNTAAITGAIAFLSIVMSLFHALTNGRGGNINQRLQTAALSVVKTLVALTALIIISFQSSKNGDANTESIARDINDSTTNIGQQSGDKRIDNPSTWAPMSLGSILSMIYWLVQLPVGAVVDVATAMMINPVDMLTSGLKDASLGRASDYEFACDRYVDSLHYIMGTTNAYANNKALSKFIISMDNLSFALYKDLYVQGYGGINSSSYNSWCYNAEMTSGTDSVEWAIVSRHAGLYHEALGIGNFADGSGGGSSTYASGRGVSDPNAILFGDGASPRTGLLLRQDGSWTIPRANDARNKLDQFYGAGEKGMNNARMSYYFAGCVWDPRQGLSALSEEWKGTRAMGESGGTNSKPIDNKDKAKDSDVESKVMGDDDKSTKNGEIIAEAQEAINWINAEKGTRKKPEYKVFLSDYDCFDPQIVAIGHNEKGREKTGSGDKNNRLERWNFNLQQDSVLTREMKKAINGFTSQLLKGMGVIGKGDDEKNNKDSQGEDTSKDTNKDDGVDMSTDSKGQSHSTADSEDVNNPMNKFGANTSGASPGQITVTTQTAADYWVGRQGAHALSVMMPLSVALAATISQAVLMSLVVGLGFIANFILALAIVVIPFILIISLLGYAINGGRR